MNAKPLAAGAVSVAVALVLATTVCLAQTSAQTSAPAPAPLAATAVAPTLDAVLCKDYAVSAVKDFADTALKPRCKRRENNRWHAVSDRHYNWCLTALIEPVKEEQKIRNGFLTRCGARAKVN